MVVQLVEDGEDCQAQPVQSDRAWQRREQSAHVVTEVSTSGLSGEENFLPTTGQPENRAAI